MLHDRLNQRRGTALQSMEIVSFFDQSCKMGNLSILVVNAFKIDGVFSVDEKEFDKCLSDIEHLHKSLQLIHQIGMQHWKERQTKIHYLNTLYHKEI